MTLFASSKSSSLFTAAGTSSDQLNKSTYAELCDATGELAIATGELTDRYDTGFSQAHELHADALNASLSAHALAAENEILSQLIEQLTLEFGFSWATLARCIGVTPTAVRKWRKTNESTRPNKQRLARLFAFAGLVREIDPRVDSVGEWMEGLVVAESSLTRVDLYRAGALVDLLRMIRSTVRHAPETVDPAAVLDAHLPGWRDEHASDSRFAVVWGEDNQPSIVVRERE